MSTRADIPHRLTYTCNCGWIDVGHLQSVDTPRNRHASASYLWKDILLERGLKVSGHNNHHLVMYRQAMSKMGFSRDFTKFYFVRKGLPLAVKRSVALAIFMEVSMGFENVQASLSMLTDSGFSEEDLVSNLIGFYVAVLGNVDWRGQCKPVSMQASLKVWDAVGPVGTRKNQHFLPQFHACEECQTVHHLRQPYFPALFASIRPAQKGVDFFEATSGLPVASHLLSTLFR
ncbi:hypothetical protein [Caldimonas brevitalea]|uniref:Uncharacterized protein n=1 Tax=Caldimonas brevitalea TaxID=413882 RepID=A0A0G3BX72_9BURK|nr:hypothetical protein [Caldimonas brevitalea]AKJ31966.1 hypothetical protein AAW51_5275 [Caldimonas brevitalea]